MQRKDLDTSEIILKAKNRGFQGALRVIKEGFSKNFKGHFERCLRRLTAFQRRFNGLCGTFYRRSKVAGVFRMNYEYFKGISVELWKIQRGFEAFQERFVRIFGICGVGGGAVSQ